MNAFHSQLMTLTTVFINALIAAKSIITNSNSRVLVLPNAHVALKSRRRKNIVGKTENALSVAIRLRRPLFHIQQERKMPS